MQMFITRWASNSAKGDAPPVLLKHITSLENAYLITTEKSVRASRHAHIGGWGAYFGEDIGARCCSAYTGFLDSALESTSGLRSPLPLVSVLVGSPF